MDVLVACDIADTATSGRRRLQRVAAVCEAYGTRVQLSVFECRLSPTRLAQLIAELQNEIDPHVDSVVVYRFPGRLSEARTDLGRPPPRELGDTWLV